MNEQTLFTAIGTVDDAYLLELDQPKVRRLPRHFGLIAAMLALLLTACAAPAILQHFDALFAAGIGDDKADTSILSQNGNTGGNSGQSCLIQHHFRLHLTALQRLQHCRIAVVFSLQQLVNALSLQFLHRKAKQLRSDRIYKNNHSVTIGHKHRIL